MTENALTYLVQQGLLNPIDVHFAHFMAKLAETDTRGLQLGAALLSRAVSSGNVCLDLNLLAGRPLVPDADLPPSLTCPRLSEWLASLKSSPVVGQPGDHCPMILDAHGRLYLQRYWTYETALAEAIKSRSENDYDETEIETERLKKSVQREFPGDGEGTTDWQKIAAITAVLKRFCVISGGPGTGKTYTIVKILAILAEQAREKDLLVKLATPTGKAAARLNQTIQSVKASLDCAPDIIGRIPEDAVTIHRLLKYNYDRGDFFYHADNRLPLETLIVDEASMVDLALMSKLVQALPDDARLVLVGDKDQLASVEAGSVLGDICGRAAHHQLSAYFHRQLAVVGGGRLPSAPDDRQNHIGLQDCIVNLQKNYRFSATSGIGKLSLSVNQGAAGNVIKMLNTADDEKVRWCPVSSSTELYHRLKKIIIDGYSDFFKVREPGEALSAFYRLQILSPLNRGPFGVGALNRFVEQALDEVHLIRRSADRQSRWYAGRPVLITANDYSQGLYNGDIGVTVNTGIADKPLYSVVFLSRDGRLKQISTFRLPDHETVYAMTVHKSQGSEFDTIHLVMPDKDSPILTRELLYTAITRSKKQVWIWGTEKVLSATVTRKIERSSGLRDALWKQ